MPRSIVFNDETGSISDALRVKLEDSYRHALADWMTQLPSPHPLDIKLTVVSSLEPGRVAETEVNGAKTIAYRDQGAGMRLMPHAAHKAITGIDNQEDVADIDVRIPRRMVDALSFDGAFDAVRCFDATTLFRHEIAHALFMGIAPDATNGNVTGWQSNLREVEGLTTFVGAHARAFLPAGIPLAGPSHLEVGVAQRFGSPLGEQLAERVVAEVTPLDRALMSDSGLPTPLDDRMVFGPWYSGEIDMGDGLDVAVIQARADRYTISHEPGTIKLIAETRYSRPGHAEAVQPELTLHNVERIQFSDSLLAFDIDGNAGTAYRLCRAVSGSEPHDAVLARQLHALDQGSTTHAVARELVATNEFVARFGSEGSDTGLIVAFYHNILGRAPDAAGYAFWRACMKDGLCKEEVFRYFAESPENKDLTSGPMGIVLHIESDDLV